MKPQGSDKLTVSHLLKHLDDNERDVIEEGAVAFFAEKGKKEKNPEKVEVKQKRFTQWWCEGKLDKHEQIKFYIIEWALNQIHDVTQKELASERFKSYINKKKSIKILKEHFENNFSLIIAQAVGQQ